MEGIFNIMHIHIQEKCLAYQDKTLLRYHNYYKTISTQLIKLITEKKSKVDIQTMIFNKSPAMSGNINFQT